MSNQTTRGPFPWRVHPVWRGIGFLLLLIVPVLAYGISEPVLQWIFQQSPTFERTLTSGTGFMNNPLVIRGIITVVLCMIIYLLYSIFGSFLYSILGGPQDEHIASHTRGGKRFR